MQTPWGIRAITSMRLHEISDIHYYCQIRPCEFDTRDYAGYGGALLMPHALSGLGSRITIVCRPIDCSNNTGALYMYKLWGSCAGYCVETATAVPRSSGGASFHCRTRFAPKFPLTFGPNLNPGKTQFATKSFPRILI